MSIIRTIESENREMHTIAKNLAKTEIIASGAWMNKTQFTWGLFAEYKASNTKMSFLQFVELRS